MSLTGNISSLRNFSAALRQLPRVVAQKAAAAAAPALTVAARETFEAGEDAFGIQWAPGADGRRVDLQKSGALARTLVYVAIGTKLRVQLGVPYAKYQIGKRPIFPRQGDELPASYSKALKEAVETVIAEELKVAA